MSLTGFIQWIHSLDSLSLSLWGLLWDLLGLLGSSWGALGSFGILLGGLSLDSFNGVKSLWASDAESVELSTLFGLQMLKV